MVLETAGGATHINGPLPVKNGAVLGGAGTRANIGGDELQTVLNWVFMSPGVVKPPDIAEWLYRLAKVVKLHY